eukprot:TRINITY_DN48894_c0_g1_i1.p1 TRINITY_DN48894_c0_g1~~TRINITY_DN48894_c0_g1_i1.p1  ORF type:complete len:177 (-),score=33.69 TRINITY_DN48894_c0_g1_i1:44-499(-)
MPLNKVKVEKLFSAYSGSDDVLQMEEFKMVLEKIGVDTSMTEQLFEAADYSHNKAVDLAEFVQWILDSRIDISHIKAKNILDRKKVEDLFNKYCGADNELQVNEFTLLLGHLGMDTMKAKAIFRAADTDRNGVVSLNEFIRWVLHDNIKIK